MEVLAPMCFIFTRRNPLSGSTPIAYSDNINVFDALVKGDRMTGIGASMVAVYCRAAQRFSIDVWVGRLGANAKSADIPTRERPLSIPAIAGSEYRGLFRLFHLTSRAAKNVFTTKDIL